MSGHVWNGQVGMTVGGCCTSCARGRGVQPESVAMWLGGLRSV